MNVAHQLTLELMSRSLQPMGRSLRVDGVLEKADAAEDGLTWLLCAFAGMRGGLSAAHQPSRLHPGVAGPSGDSAATAAVPSVTCSGQGLSSTLAASAPAVCKVLEAFVRRQAGLTNTLPQELLHETMCQVFVACSVGADSLQEARPLVALAAAAGPGSELQLQLFSLWRGILKWSLTAGFPPTFEEFFPPRLCADTAVFLLMCTRHEVTAAGALAVAPAEQSSAAASPHRARSGASRAVSSSHGSNSSTSATHPGLMWLVLLGHCCFAWAAMLHAHRTASSDDPCDSIECVGHSSPVGDVIPLESSSSGPDVYGESKDTTRYEPGPPIPVRVVADAVLRILGAQHSSMAQQLPASGYDVEQVKDSAAAVLDATDALSEAPDSHTRKTVLAQLEPALDALGVALTSLAAPYCCNNPNCCNLSGPSDMALVSGKSCICGKCKVARYCGKACQQQHWRLHKPVCKALAAAQEAAQPSNSSGHS